MLRPVMPTWRARGSQPRSVTLRVAASSAPSASSSGSSCGVLLGRDALADARRRRVASASTSRSSSRVRASRRTRPRGGDGALARRTRRCTRGRELGQHPGAHGRHLRRRSRRGSRRRAGRRTPASTRRAGRRRARADRVAGEAGAESPRRRGSRPRDPTPCSARACAHGCGLAHPAVAAGRDVLLDGRAPAARRPSSAPQPPSCVGIGGFRR